MTFPPLSRAVSTALLGLTFSGAALAIEPATYTTNSGIVITPTLNSGLAYDDNIFSQPSNKAGSSIFTLAPSVNFLLDDGINQYQFDAAFESGTFIDSSDDNYLSSNLGGSAHLEPNSSSRIDTSLTANWGVEPRGTGITEGAGDNVDEPLAYAEQTLAATYEYGAMSSNARVAFDGKYYNKNYSNFATLTDSRNFDSMFLGSTFFYTTNSGTDAFVELNRDAIRYDVSEAISRDSNDYHALVGVKWQATALTSGSVKLGYQRKEFTSSARADFDGISWDAAVNWQPLTYSTVMLTTSRRARDPNVEGDYISESLYGVNWLHQWSDLISTGMGANFTKENYGGVSRKDDTLMLNASIDFSLRRWLDASFYVSVTDKDSTRDNILFDKSLVGLNFTVSM